MRTARQERQEVSQIDLIKEVATIRQIVEDTKSDVTDIKNKLDKDYATKGELRAVEEKLTEKYDLPRKVVFGIVSLILMSVFGALIALVINAKGSL